MLKGFQFAFCQMKAAKMALQTLAEVSLTPILNGAVAGAAISAGTLWSEGPAAIFVIRRPG